jgi:citrate lyase subunit beta / citryl-CoA lyase
MELLRSLLFVPADSGKKIEKARTLRPDVLIFDLEDAVSPDRKSEARTLLSAELRSPAKRGSRIFVRVNSVGSAFFSDDLNVAVDAAVDALVLPKCGSPAEIAQADRAISQAEGQRGIPPGKLKLVLILETALGVVRAYELARSSARPIALNFGAEDYSADMGINRSQAVEQITFARSMVAQAAHAAGLEAIDTVFTDFHNEAGLVEEVRQAKLMGYTGKALIHPSQIEPVHRAFAPTDPEVAWAKEVMEAFEAAKTSRSGVIAVGGRMVDEPVVIQARRILQQSRA